MVMLNVNGVDRNIAVDVRENLWETLTYKLGMANSVNLGCDRGQCGACTIVVDGRAMNSCMLLTVRLGRGQRIVTVDSLSRGPGKAGLHPIQRAFWEEGAFQCGFCARGMIMATYALLLAESNPADADIAKALLGNICRCGAYPRIYQAVHRAAAEAEAERSAERSRGPTPEPGTGHGPQSDAAVSAV